MPQDRGMVDTLAPNTQEYIEFVIKLKMQEMQQGLDRTLDEIKSFDRDAKKSFKSTGDEIEKTNRKGKKFSDDFGKNLDKLKRKVKSFTQASAASFAVLATSIGLVSKETGGFQEEINTLEAWC